MPDSVPRPSILAISYLFPNAAEPGYGVFVLNRLKAVQRFCNVTVIAPVQWYPFIKFVKRTARAVRIPPVETIGGVDSFHPRFAVIPRYMKWLDCLTYCWAVVRMALRLRKTASFEFDLVDVHWTYPDLLAGFVLARWRRKKFLVTLRGHEAFYDEEVSIRRWIVAKLLRRADFVIALSVELAEKAMALNIASDKVRVVLNGVDPTNFRYVPQSQCRERLGLSGKNKVLVSVGRITKRKGHHELIEIMPSLVEQVGATDLYLIGGVHPDDEYRSILGRLIDDLELTNVHILDAVEHENLHLWYGAADLFCLATMSEGCPNVVLEALACGAPVVAKGVGAIRELVSQNEDGYVVHTSDSLSFGEAVCAALKRQWDRRMIAKRMESRGWATCAEEVFAVYRSLLSGA